MLNQNYAALVVLALLLSGCAPAALSPTAIPSVSEPSASAPLRGTPTLSPSAQPVIEFTPTHPATIQPAATTTPIASPSPAKAACLPADIDPYLKEVLPLADAHTVDTYQAQKMEALPEASRVGALRDSAILRLEQIRGIQAPACLLTAHQKMTESFALLVSTWDFIEAKDYPQATRILKNCYEVLAEATAEIALLQ